MWSKIDTRIAALLDTAKHDKDKVIPVEHESRFHEQVQLVEQLRDAAETADEMWNEAAYAQDMVDDDDRTDRMQDEVEYQKYRYYERVDNLEEAEATLISMLEGSYEWEESQ